MEIFPKDSMKNNKLHQSAFVLDSHCDTPIRLLNGASLSERGAEGHFDFIRMKEVALMLPFLQFTLQIT